jgi:Bacterial regulatory helix-turn-helix protein, lysR family
MSHRRSIDGISHPESAIAAIWLVFYGLALGAALASPLVAGALELASR